jgi:3-deoxy-D-manno-octulosonic-acid transferase
LPIESADSTNVPEDAALWLGRGGVSELIVAGSTAAGEEDVLLNALRLVRQKPGLQFTRLAIAPRRPERFDEVARLVSEFGFKLARRSQSLHARDAAPGQDTDKSAVAEVLLLDSIGELAAAYKAASVVFVGGSLVPRGGHNIIEAAVHSKPIIVGAHTYNFRQIVSDFTSGDALVQVSTNNPQELADHFARLLTDSVHASALGNRARAILEKNRGATECTVAAISQLLREARRDSGRSDDR